MHDDAMSCPILREQQTSPVLQSFGSSQRSNIRLCVHCVVVASTQLPVFEDAQQYGVAPVHFFSLHSTVLVRNGTFGAASVFSPALAPASVASSCSPPSVSTRARNGRRSSSARSSSTIVQ